MPTMCWAPGERRGLPRGGDRTQVRTGTKRRGQEPRCQEWCEAKGSPRSPLRGTLSLSPPVSPGSLTGSHRGFVKNGHGQVQGQGPLTTCPCRATLSTVLWDLGLMWPFPRGSPLKDPGGPGKRRHHAWSQEDVRSEGIGTVPGTREGSGSAHEGRAKRRVMWAEVCPRPARLSSFSHFCPCPSLLTPFPVS